MLPFCSPLPKQLELILKRSQLLRHHQLQLLKLLQKRKKSQRLSLKKVKDLRVRRPKRRASKKLSLLRKKRTLPPNLTPLLIRRTLPKRKKPPTELSSQKYNHALTHKTLTANLIPQDLPLRKLQLK